MDVQEFHQMMSQMTADIKLNLVTKYPEYKNQLEGLQLILKTNIEAMNKKHPEWFTRKDIRINVLLKELSVISSTKLAFLEQKYFVERSDETIDLFYKEIIPENVRLDAYGQIGYIRDLDTTIRFSCFQRMFGNYEAFIKMIAVSIPKATTNYKGFVTDYLRIRKQDDGFLNVLRWVRNSIHNNGLHFPDKSSDDNLKFNYRGRDIEFIKEHWVDVSWDDILHLSEDIINLTFEIITNQEIENIPFIEDITERKDKIFNKN